MPLLLTNLSSAQRKQNVRAVLELVGLSDRATHKPSELSGGQQQRVSIARALVADPTLLVCDEPTGDLDRENAEEILKLLQMLNRQQGKTIIMVTHDPLAADHASRILHVDKGRLVDSPGAERRMKYFMLIWAGLWRKKTRTILTMLSIVVAFLLFGLLQGINQGIKAGLGDTGNHRLWTTERMSAMSSMPTSLMDRMQTVKGVRNVAHLSFFGGYFQDAKNPLPAFATNVDKLAVVYPELNITPAQIAAMKATRPGALIGRPLAKKYGWKVGDKIPVGTTIWTNNDGSNNWAFDIVGIFDPTPQFAKSPLGSRLLDQLRLLGRGAQVRQSPGAPIHRANRRSEAGRRDFQRRSTN